MALPRRLCGPLMVTWSRFPLQTSLLSAWQGLAPGSRRGELQQRPGPALSEFWRLGVPEPHSSGGVSPRGGLSSSSSPTPLALRKNSWVTSYARPEGQPQVLGREPQSCCEMGFPQNVRRTGSQHPAEPGTSCVPSSGGCLGLAFMAGGGHLSACPSHRLGGHSAWGLLQGLLSGGPLTLPHQKFGQAHLGLGARRGSSPTRAPGLRAARASGRSHWSLVALSPQATKALRRERLHCPGLEPCPRPRALRSLQAARPPQPAGSGGALSGSPFPLLSRLFLPRAGRRGAWE